MPFAGNDTPPHCKYMSPYVSDSDILLKALKPIKKTPLTGVGWGQIVLKLWKYSSSNSRSSSSKSWSYSTRSSSDSRSSLLSHKMWLWNQLFSLNTVRLPVLHSSQYFVSIFTIEAPILQLYLFPKWASCDYNANLTTKGCSSMRDMHTTAKKNINKGWACT